MAGKWIGLLLAASAAAGCQTLDKTITDMGYGALRPPQRLIQPGTVVWVRDDQPGAISIICTAESAYGAPLAVETSPTQTQSWSQRTSGGFELEAGYRDRINAEIEGAGVRKVTIHLTNAAVRTTSAAEVAQAAINGQLSPACVSATQTFRNLGRNVSIVSSVLEADVLYRIEYDASVSAEAQARITREIAPQLMASASNTGVNTISGTALFWGIAEDSALVDIYLGTAQSSSGPWAGAVNPGVMGVQGMIARVPAGRQTGRLIPADNLAVVPLESTQD